VLSKKISLATTGLLLVVSAALVQNPGKANAAFFASQAFEATWVAQTQAGTVDQFFHVAPCQAVDFQATFKNSGTTTWQKTGADQVAFNIYKDPAVVSYPRSFSYQAGVSESYFQDPSWLTPYRIATITEDSVAPGNNATLNMKFQVNCAAQPGYYREDISMAAGPLWMKNVANGDPLKVAHIWVGFLVDKPVAQTDTSNLSYINKDGAIAYLRLNETLYKFDTGNNLTISTDDVTGLPTYPVYGFLTDFQQLISATRFSNNTELLFTTRTVKNISSGNVVEYLLPGETEYTSVFYLDTAGTGFAKEVFRTLTPDGLTTARWAIRSVSGDNFFELNYLSCSDCGGFTAGETFAFDQNGYQWNSAGETVQFEWSGGRTYRFKEAIKNLNANCGQLPCSGLDKYVSAATLPWKIGSL